jgi:hypothetical protein
MVLCSHPFLVSLNITPWEGKPHSHALLLGGEERSNTSVSFSGELPGPELEIETIAEDPPFNSMRRSPHSHIAWPNSLHLTIIF